MATIDISINNGWSYNAEGGYRVISSFDHTIGDGIYINSITIQLGTLNGHVYGYGSDLTGDGTAIESSVQILDKVTQSNTITNKVGVYSEGSGSLPVVSDCKPCEFTYASSNRPLIPPRTTVTIAIYTPKTSSGSTGKVLAMNDGANITIDYEVYTSNYTVTFDLAGGTRTGGGDLVQSVPPGGSATPPTCTRTGYDFFGWSGDYTNVTSDRTITATWSIKHYTITYNANGGSNAPPAGDKTYGNPYTITSATPTGPALTITFDPVGGTVNPTSKTINRPFTVWNTNANGTGTSYASGSQYTNNASVTLYAQYGNPALGTLPTPIRTDCQFVGWYKESNYVTQVSSTTTVSSNTTLYAKWKYKIVLDGNGGLYYNFETGESGESVVLWQDYNVALKLPTNLAWTYNSGGAVPSKEYEGYSTSRNGSVEYEAGDNITFNEPKTLYVIYETKMFTVKFTDGYSGAVLKTQQVPFGGSATPPPDPTRSGYTFLGWIGIYTNVMTDSTVMALWDFAPIWIMTKNGWVKYEPEE